MTDALARPEPTEIVIPGTGELVSLDDPAQVAAALTALKQHTTNVSAVRHLLEAVLAEESERQGTKTLRIGDYVATIGPGSDLDWDLDELAKLRDAGLPEERYNALVKTTVDYKVDARVASQIEKANPDYARIIGNARIRIPKRASVRVDKA